MPMSTQTRAPKAAMLTPREVPAIKNQTIKAGSRTPEGPKVRVNQILHGRPAEIIIELKRAGYYRTTSQAVNEAVIQLGDLHIERQLKVERLKMLEDEKE